MSAESGVPTFRGAGGWWRRYQATDLATPGAFREQPSLVWEFYHHRRHQMASKHPNKVSSRPAARLKAGRDNGRRHHYGHYEQRPYKFSDVRLMT